MAFVREQTINPYVPDRVYSLGDNTGQFSDQDIGKAVKQDSASGNLVQCVAEDNIFGIVAAVEPYTRDGHSIGGVSCDVICERYATDEAGTLTRGTAVVSGTPAALGTPEPNFGPPVKAPTTPPVAAPHIWEVVEVYGSGAGRKVLIRKVS